MHKKSETASSRPKSLKFTPQPHEIQNMLKKSIKSTMTAIALTASVSISIPAAAYAATPLRGFMFGIPSSTMNKADWSAFHDAASKLLSKMPSTIGQSEDWQGPSGANGTLTIEKIYEQHDMPCRDVHAQFNNKRESRKLNYSIAVCRDAQGEWRLGS